MAHAGVRLGHGGAGHCVDSVVQYGQSLRVDEFRLPALIWLDMAVKKRLMPGIAEHAVPGISVCAESGDVDISDVDIVVRRVGVCRMKISTVMRCAQ